MSMTIDADDTSPTAESVNDIVLNQGTKSTDSVHHGESTEASESEAAPPPSIITLQEILTNPNYHVDRERWFDLLQDDGVQMTPEEFSKFSTPEKGKRSNKHYRIGTKGFFYGKLYQLASLVLEKMKQHPRAFPRLNHASKNVSAAIHLIGRKIAEMRKCYARGDLHNMGRDIGFNDLMEKSVYDIREKFYILSQQQLVEYLFIEKYGPERENKRVTTDDKVRVAGILFMDDDMRKCITSMVGSSRAGPRSDIDATPGLIRSGFRLLHDRFTDKDVNISLPTAWTCDATRQAIDDRHGPGTYDAACTFNPNNLVRIVLPWSESEVKAIFDKMLTEYQSVMHFYTKGTGGGPGAPEHYADWWHRPAECVVGYIQQPCNFYLTVVHMWDKQFRWKLTCEQDPMPRECVIDDGVNFDNDANEEREGNYVGGGILNEEDAITPRRIFPPTSTTSQQVQQKNTTSSQKEKTMTAALDRLRSDRDTNRAAAGEMISIMRRMEESHKETSTNVNRQPHELMNDIKNSRKLIQECTEELKTMKQRKRDLSINSDENQKKIKLISKDIKRQKTLLETMKATLDDQVDALHSIHMTNAKKRKGDSSSSGSDDDDSSDNE